MARIVEQFSVPVTKARAFDYVADFTSTATWDPMIRAARALDPDGPALGTRYEVELMMGKRVVPLVYTVTRYERPDRVVLETRSRWFRGVDDIRIGGGEDEQHAIVRWDATFALRGPLAVVDPLLGFGFRRVAAKAVAGLRRELTSLAGR
jgi:hypothetical protein